MTNDEHKAWLDGLKPGDTVVSAYKADHPTYDWVATVVRRTPQRIVVQRGAVHIQCEAKNGELRGGHHYHSIYPLTDVMRKNASIKATAEWCAYQATRDLMRLTPDNQAAIKALVEKLLAEQKVAGK